MKSPKLTIPELSEDSGRFIEQVQAEPDRGAALVGAAYLDDVLASLLRAHFVDDPATVRDLLDEGRPLGSFAAKTHLAYCLGLIGPQTRADLDLIRQIRNEFAHKHHEARFDLPSIADRCAQLNVPQLLEPTPIEHPRYRFIVTVTLLANHLLLNGLEAKPAPPGRDLTRGARVNMTGKGEGG